MRLTLIFTFLVFYTGLSFAQKTKKVVLPVDSSTNTIMYEEVVTVAGATQNDLYLRAKEWFARTFRSAQDVIQLDDKQAGKIIGKAYSVGSYTYMMTPATYKLHYIVGITAKDGRYRYEVSSFKISWPATSEIALEDGYKIYNNDKGTGLAIYKRIFPFVESNSLRLITSIKDALRQPATGVKSKDDF